MCELLAIKLLSAYGSAPQSLDLLHILTLCLNPFAGATTDSFSEDEGVDEHELARLLAWGEEESSNALELGIFSKAKRFVRSPLVQQVIKAIYVGDVMYTPHSAHSMIKDDYKAKPVVEVYDWRRQPFLDHNRLRVPRIRNRLEFLTYSTILVLFLLVELSEPKSFDLRLRVALTIWHPLQRTILHAYQSSNAFSSCGVWASPWTRWPQCKRTGGASGRPRRTMSWTDSTASTSSPTSVSASMDCCRATRTSRSSPSTPSPSPDASSSRASQSPFFAAMSCFWRFR